MSTLNLALYYPSMEFSNIPWVKGMTLFWDGIRRIVPESYAPRDSEEIKEYIEAGIITSISPEADASDIVDEFVEKLEGPFKGAAALDYIRDDKRDPIEKTYRIHPEKVDQRLRELLTDENVSKMTKGWLEVSEDFGRFYMLYLANAMANKRGLAKITDSEEAWTATTFYEYDGQLDEYPNFESDKNIATLMLQNYMPSNMANISPSTIIKYREDHREERRRFIDSIKSFVTGVSDIEDADVINEAIHEYSKDVESSLIDFKDSLRSLRIQSFIGLKTIAFPIISSLLTLNGTGGFEYTLLGSASGLALGFLTSYDDYQQKKKKLRKENDFSYLYDLNSSLDKRHYDGGNLNYHLYRNIEEFIND